MKLMTVKQFGQVPKGTQVWLTPGQASAREGLVTVVLGKDDKPARSGDRGLYLTQSALGFKAGEELAIEGSTRDLAVEHMFEVGRGQPAGKGDRKPTKTAAGDRRVTEARAAHKAAGDAVATARQAVASATTPEGKAAAEKQLAAASQAQASAKAKVREAAGG